VALCAALTYADVRLSFEIVGVALLKILASNWRNRWLASVFLFLAWSPAMAAWCTSTSPVATLNINLGTVSEATADRMPVGSVIYTVSGDWDAYGGHNAGWCQNLPAGNLSPIGNLRVKTKVYFSMLGTPVQGYWNDVYPTNLAGVGVRIYIWNPSSYYGTPTRATAIPLSFTADLQNSLPSMRPAYGTGGLRVRVEVIKTAPNWQAGSLRYVGGQLRVTAADNASNSVTLTQVSIMGTMNTRSCSVAAGSRNVSVNMREVAYPNGFSGRQAGAYGPTIPFRITMNCVSGPRTSIQFDPVTAIAGKPDILGLTPNSSNASGIGVQLLSSVGVPLQLRTPVLLTARAPDGASTYSFGGRYILTGEPVRGGRADATSIFTMMYE
jgi:type 1 fimbria pilin